MSRWFRLMVLPILLVFGGCATSFTGAAHIESGPKGCMAICTGWGLEFAGMVAMGAYSNACICNKPGKKVEPAQAAAAVGSAVGVVMQQRRNRDN
jgi:hypothetical protein